MPDYKKMYFKLFRASARAANILIAAQKECEALYIADSEPVLEVFEAPGQDNKSAGDA